MKTNERMIFALIGAAACSFFFGLGQHEAPAQVANCVNSCCEPLYSWWIKGVPGGTQAYSAQVNGATAPLGTGDNTRNAMVSVFIPATTPGGCKLGQDGIFDRWIFPTCTVACAKDKLGNYPTPQSVTPIGTPKPDPDGIGKPRNTCVQGGT